MELERLIFLLHVHKKSNDAGLAEDLSSLTVPEFQSTLKKSKQLQHNKSIITYNS